MDLMDAAAPKPKKTNKKSSPKKIIPKKIVEVKSENFNALQEVKQPQKEELLKSQEQPKQPKDKKKKTKEQKAKKISQEAKKEYYKKYSLIDFLVDCEYFSDIKPELRSIEIKHEIDHNCIVLENDSFKDYFLFKDNVLFIPSDLQEAFNNKHILYFIEMNFQNELNNNNILWYSLNGANQFISEKISREQIKSETILFKKRFRGFEDKKIKDIRFYLTFLGTKNKCASCEVVSKNVHATCIYKQ